VPVEPPVVSPASLAEAYAVAAGASHRPLAGGTDLLVQLTGEIGEPPDRVLDLWRLDELRGIAVRDGALELGALTTYTDIRRSALCAEHAPALVEAAATIGAAQIQNRGTLGGNAMNASPAGDTLPVLLALDAALVAGSATGERAIAASDFWSAYRTTAVHADELLVRVRVPIVTDRRQRFRKVGTRRAQAISKVVVALAWTEEPAHRAWHNVRLALGSVAPTPIRASSTETLLEGATPTPETADRAVAALAAELEPIDDVRSTAAYRREVATRVLRRLVRDAGGW
jgi:CO/xanthine dehydrogenase FAD-binding subunit